METKNEQINIAIAKACGWANCINPDQDEYHFLTTFELRSAMGRPVGRRLPTALHEAIPNYCSDLNAMHEAELAAFKTGGAWDEYFDFLSIVCEADNDPITATARQRAEAFLRTLNKYPNNDPS